MKIKISSVGLAIAWLMCAAVPAAAQYNPTWPMPSTGASGVDAAAAARAARLAALTRGVGVAAGAARVVDACARHPILCSLTAVGAAAVAGAVARSSTRNGTGDCTPGDHSRMQQEVDQYCKVQRSCSKSESRVTLTKKVELNQICIAARERINRTCFRGGDPSHQIAVDDAVRALIRCQTLLGTSP